MNGNRSRYSTNPTFTMQKRGLFRKSPAAATEKPDFNAVPDNGAAQQTLFSQTMPLQGSAPGVQSPMQSADLFNTSMNSASPAGFQTPGFGVNAFGMQQIPMQNHPSGFYPAQSASAPFSYSAQQPVQQNLPPLGNQTGLNQSAPFAPHNQGFTPPQPAQGMQQGAYFAGMNTAQPTQKAGPAAPLVQPASFSINAPNSFDNTGMQQSPMGYPQNSFGLQQPVGSAQQMGYGQTPPRNSQPMDADTLWKLFLFVLLPVLFVPCLFIPASLNVLRYVFLALCAAGLGVLWYRQMFKPNNRIILTLCYAAACVVIIVMLFQGGSQDLQQTDPNTNPQQQSNQALGAAPGNGTDITQPTFSPTPEPTPTVEPVSEAQTRLEAFMTNWSGARIEDMVRLVQPSWASQQDNPSNRLFVMLGNRTPLTYTIEEISGSDNDSSRTVTMTANIDKNNGKDPTLYRFMVLMVKEGGEWYVDPNSLASNDEVTNSEETNVVNDSQNTTAENWTIAPRQTVTPAPPGSQLLYYNPDGGSMYHMDQYCSSIREEYLPLQGSFAYSELGSHSDLTPCLKCGAPTQTLPPEDTSEV